MTFDFWDYDLDLTPPRSALNLLNSVGSDLMYRIQVFSAPMVQPLPVSVARSVALGCVLVVQNSVFEAVVRLKRRDKSAI